MEDAKPMEKMKRVEINWPIKKYGGFFAGSVLKWEEMGSCPLLSIGFYPAIKDMDITRISSPN